MSVRKPGLFIGRLLAGWWREEVGVIVRGKQEMTALVKTFFGGVESDPGIRNRRQVLGEVSKGLSLLWLTCRVLILWSLDAGKVSWKI